MTHSRRGQPKLRGLLDAGTIPKGVYKKREYFARLDKEGRIHIGDHVFQLSDSGERTCTPTKLRRMAILAIQEREG